ncbi:MAG: hypothetical protein KKH06_01745 [Gammaproteobacteria bacterium]|nr:hypothetical protein [Gammaproteobacteria bacterium]MBU1628797.1 hypothetical protein [Gammaproteobacteria bacterium]
MFDFFKSTYSSFSESTYFSFFQSAYSYFFAIPFRIFVEYDQYTHIFHLRFSGKNAAFHREHLTKIIKTFTDLSVQEGLKEDNKRGFENASQIKKIQKMEREIASKMTKELTRWKHPVPPGLRLLNDQFEKKQRTYPLYDISDVQNSVFELLKKKPIEVRPDQILLTVDKKLKRMPDIFEGTYLANSSEDKSLPQSLLLIWNDPVVQDHRSRVLLDQMFLHPYLRPKNTPRGITEWVQELENNTENEEYLLEQLKKEIQKSAPGACYREPFDWPQKLEDEDSYVEVIDEKPILFVKSKYKSKNGDGKYTVFIIPLTKAEVRDDISVARTSTSIECFKALSENEDELLLYLMVFNLRAPVTKAFENLKAMASVAYSMDCRPINITENGNNVSYQFDTPEKSSHFLKLLDWLEILEIDEREEIKSEQASISKSISWNKVHL